MGVGSGVIQDLTQMLNCGGGNCNCDEINARLARLEIKLNGKVNQASLNPIVTGLIGSALLTERAFYSGKFAELASGLTHVGGTANKAMYAASQAGGAAAAAGTAAAGTAAGLTMALMRIASLVNLITGIGNTLMILMSVYPRLDAHDDALAAHDNDLSRLWTEIGRIKAFVTESINKLYGFLGETNDRAIAALNTARDALYATGDIKKAMEGLSARIDALEQQLKTALNTIGSLESIINDLKSQVKEALGKFGSLESIINGLKGDINTLKPQVQSNTTDINSLKPQVQGNTTDINSLKPQAKANTNEIEQLKQNKSDKTELNCQNLSQTMSRCGLKPPEKKPGDDMQYSSISVKIFKQCNPGTKEPEFESKSIQVIKGTENQEIFNFERLFNIESQQCKITEPMAVVPEWWQTRPGQRPQLVILYANILDNGKLGGSRWSVSIPHYNRDQNYKPQFPSYFRGDVEGIMRLADNTKIIVNCKDSTECKRVLNVFKQFIDQKMLENVNIKIGERFGNSYKKTRVVPVRCSFFSDGQKDMLPTWFLDLKKKK